MSTAEHEVITDDSTAIAETQATPLQQAPQVGSVSPLAMMLESGEHSLEKIERLWEINKEWEGREARKAYVNAKARIREELKPIAKNRKNSHLGSEYADIDAMLDGVGPIAGKHGVDVDFAYDQESISGSVITSCSATHDGGHTETRKATFPIMDPIRGQKGNATNECQMVGVSMTYGRRYSFSALFAVACGNDNDGNGGTPQNQQRNKTPKTYNVAPLVRAIDKKDGFAIIDIMVELDANGQTEIFNSFKPGEVSKRKADARKLMADAQAQIKEALKQLTQCMNRDDEHGALEILGETNIKYITPRASEALNKWINGTRSES